jgi:queuine/archaeosine tRNA-ribosyltransferase
MTYSTSNPPILIAQGIGGALKTFKYTSTDTTGDVDAAGYITNGYDLGLRAGDQVIALDNDASPLALTSHVVTTATSTSVDLSNGVDIGSTNS